MPTDAEIVLRLKSWLLLQPQVAGDGSDWEGGWLEGFTDCRKEVEVLISDDLPHFLKQGDRVIVTSGQFRGLKGSIERPSDHLLDHLVVQLDAFTFTVEIPATSLEERV